MTKAIIAALVLVLALAAPAWADNLDDAKAAFAQGKAAFERGDYERALAEFEKANALAPAPTLHYNLGSTYEKLQRYNEAAQAFQRYLDQVGAPTTDDQRRLQEEVRQRIAENQRRAARPSGTPAPPPSYPPPQYPPPQYPPAYGQPYGQPYGYGNPYGAGYYPQPVNPLSTRIAAAKRKRDGGIRTLVAGCVLLGTGLIFFGTTAALTDGFTDFSGVDETAGIVLMAFGIPFTAMGVVFLPVGIAVTASGNAEYKRLLEQQQRAVPGQPQAFKVPLLSFRF